MPELDPPPPWTLSQPQALAGPPGEDPEATLRALRELLLASDSQALELWQTQHATLRHALPAQSARRVAQAMKALDFDAALAALPLENA